MTVTTQILKGVTGVIVTYPPETASLYQASAATARVRTPSTPMPDAGSSCTVDSVDTTVSGTAERSAGLITLASGVGVVAGRRYLIVDASERYTVTVADVDGASVYVEEPLLRDIGSGASFVGVAVTISLTTAQTSQSGRSGLASFTATLDGAARTWDQWFEIVDAVFPVTLTPNRLAKRAEAVRWRDPRSPSMRDLIDSAWTDILRPKLRAAGILEETIHTPTEVEPAHIEACLLLLARGRDSDVEMVEAQEDRLARSVSELVDSCKLFIDAEENNAPASNADPYGEHRVSRLTR